MIENNLTLFQYLKSTKINHDEQEFKFQFKSHPDYPSLLALSDTLSFFNIVNGAIKVNSSEIEQLPNNFLAKLNRNNNDLLYVENKGDDFYVINEPSKKKELISKEELIKLWGGIVLLVENDETNTLKAKPKKLNYILITSCLLLLVAVLWQMYYSLLNVLFYIFPIIGFMFSLGALIDVFNTKSELLDKLCKATTTSNCETVVNSSKWKVLEKFSFSDLSITFFSSQIIALFIMGLAGNYLDYFTIQGLLLLFSIPIIILSIYYQGYIEKKWCPICLSISAVILLELVYIIVGFNSILFTLTKVFSYILYAFIYIVILMIWYALKNILTNNNQLKEAELKANRFKRNYTIFKNTLISKPKISLPQNTIILGNKNAALNITIITSPFCGFCKEPHYMLENILKKHERNIAVKVLYNFNMNESKDENLKLLYRTLFYINQQKGDLAFNAAMKSWYKNKDIKKWLSKYSYELNTKEIDLVLETQYKWCIENQFNFTPSLFINGYKYPEAYDISDLPYYIEELLNDNKI